MSAHQLRDAVRHDLEKQIKEYKDLLAADFGSDLAGIRQQQGRILGLSEAIETLNEKLREQHG